ncbi:uncharacterized protein KGF55_002158 [Candida pseudojiufengensis]|uniref:uncharacterized protein n=1 Tax=Candida pseudojiufengensis TaxID=497109 RepID=UPI0022256D6F|nr:uncharacterized protein KGF55_002158 [Candida pseudojiufengensis]KAI5964216.1 hypothetical protein KGF55_002158 [Candida pseudojiufengensis]
MQILKEREAFLSNFEVAEHLNAIKQKYNWTFTQQDELEQNQQNQQQQQQTKRKNRFTECGINLEIITKDILQFIQNSNSNLINEPTIENFKKMMEFLNQFELMKVEKLQIMNQLPRSLVVLYLLIEDCEERFNEEQSQGIIDKIQELFPIEQTYEEDEEEGVEEEDGEGEIAAEGEEEEDVEME